MQTTRPASLRVTIFYGGPPQIHFFFFGSFLRLVFAMSRSCFSDIDLTICLEAPFRLDFFTSPRFAANAAPAAICCFLERAGITLYRSLPCDWLHVPSIRNLTCSLGLDRTGRYPSPQPFLQIRPSMQIWEHDICGFPSYHGACNGPALRFDFSRPLRCWLGMPPLRIRKSKFSRGSRSAHRPGRS